MLSNKSNKELVEAGHQFAKALDADMPLTEIAKLVSALSTRLDCAIVRGDELQQKLDAMAAENAALMKFCKNAAFDADYESELGMERGGFTDAINDIKTPATDAYLNSVRAEGIEMLADNLATPSPELADGTNAINKAVSWYARKFANRLRSGTHDTADKAGAK